MKKTFLMLALLFAVGAFSTTGFAQLKKRLAVSRFEDRSGTGYNHLGAGVADMLATALIKSGKFVIIERQDLDKVLEEQHLGAEGVLTPETAPKAGKVLGVELIVVGSVTEFGTSERNIGGNVPMFGGSLSTKKSRAVVDLRLVNTTTGEVIAAETEEGSESTTGVSVRYENIDFSTASSWEDTDLGKACRAAVNGCVQLIADNMKKIPWSGKILKVNADGTVLMKPGSEGNVESGMKFDVFRAGEEVKDPDTGLSLGAEETKVGTIKVIEDALKGKAAKATVTDGAGFKAGDIVRARE